MDRPWEALRPAIEAARKDMQLAHDLHDVAMRTAQVGSTAEVSAWVKYQRASARWEALIDAEQALVSARFAQVA